MGELKEMNSWMKKYVWKGGNTSFVIEVHFTKNSSKEWVTELYLNNRRLTRQELLALRELFKKIELEKPIR
jgi:hypothetical protein